MLNMQKAFKSERKMKAITGLSLEEFKKLESTFAAILDKTKNDAKTSRQRAPGGGRKHTLSTVTEKLFFVLCYMKCYPTFDMIALCFDVDSAQAHRWVHTLVPVLEQALKKTGMLPKRHLRNTTEFCKLFPEIRHILIDGTERPIQRSKEEQTQKATYSGKKKRHTKKNLVVTTLQRTILILSPTKEGKEHDYRSLKEEKIGERIPENVVVSVDLGFQGIRTHYPQLTVCIPHKKPRNGVLSEEQKQENQCMSRVRVLVEHAIGGIKRFKSISDVYRNHKKGFEDTLMLIACGLWNFHLKTS